MKKRVLIVPLALVMALFIHLRADHKEVESFEKRYSYQNSPSVKKAPKRHQEKPKRSPASASEPIEFERNIEASKAIYKKMSQYPTTSRPLNPQWDIDPIENKYGPQTHDDHGLDSFERTLSTSMDKSYYSTHDKDIVLNISTFFSNAPVPSEIKIIRNKKWVLTPYQLDEGQYKLHLSPSEIGVGTHHLSVHAFIRDEEVVSQVSFRVDEHYVDDKGQSKAELDQEGNLVFSHSFDFLKVGNYLIEGTLYDSEGQLVAKANSTIQNADGLQSIELNFYGFIFYEQKLSGPFELRYVEVTKLDDNLASSGNQLFTLSKKSPSISWDQFNSAPFQNQEMLKKLSHLK